MPTSTVRLGCHTCAQRLQPLCVELGMSDFDVSVLIQATKAGNYLVVFVHLAVCSTTFRRRYLFASLLSTCGLHAGFKKNRLCRIR